MTSLVIQESNDSRVPVTRALLKANPALHSALLRFETSQLKLERAYVVPFGRPAKLAPPLSSDEDGDDVHHHVEKAVTARDPISEAMARRASLWSQDSDDESSEDGSDVWGDDEDDSSDSESDDAGSDSGSEWSAGEEDEEDVRAVIPRGRRLLRSPDRSRSRSPVPAPAPTASDADEAAVPTASLPRFSQPPLPASFVLRIPEGRQWRNSAPPTPDLLASSPIEPTASSSPSSASLTPSSSSSSAYSIDRSPRFEPLTRQLERDDDEVTLFDEAEVRTEDTAVDLDETWERAMRFSGWIRRPSQMATEPEEELGRWEYKGRKDRASLGARQDVVEGLRRLVEMVQA